MQVIDPFHKWLLFRYSFVSITCRISVTNSIIELIIVQFQYIKIQPNTIDLSMSLGNKPHKLCSYSPEPRAEVYCFKLNFNISKFVYSKGFLLSRLRVVPLSLSPSCMTRKKIVRKKWPCENLGARSTRKEGLPPKPKSLPFQGRVIFRCRISYLDVFSLAPVVNSRGRCFNKNTLLFK